MKVMLAGVAVVDFVFHLDEMPRRAEKYRAREATISGGGNAANAAVAVARLGGEAMLASRLGDDEVADLIEAGLAREGVETSFVQRFAGHRSSFSSIFVAGGERQIVNFRDHTLPMSAQWFDPPPFDVALADTRWPDGAARLMAAAGERGRPGIIDAEAPVMEAAEALELASHVAFSAQGLCDYCGHDAVHEALREADGRLPGIVLVTDGEKGTTWIEDGEMHHAAAARIEPVDTLAAGDVWHGAFALRLARGDDLGRAVRYANAAATLKCTRIGGRDGAPDAAEVDKFMKGSA